MYKIPAEVILLCEAVVDVTDQKSWSGLVKLILKVTNDRGEGLLLRPVYGDDVQSVQADFQQLQV